MSKIMKNIPCLMVHFALLTSVTSAEQPKWSQVFWMKDIPSIECPIEIYNSGPFVLPTAVIRALFLSFVKTRRLDFLPTSRT